MSAHEIDTRGRTVELSLMRHAVVRLEIQFTNGGDAHHFFNLLSSAVKSREEVRLLMQAVELLNESAGTS